MRLTRGTAVRVNGGAIVEPYAGMTIDELQVLKMAAQRYYTVLPKDHTASIREWGTRIMEEANGRGPGRVFYTYSLRIAAENLAGNLLSIWMKYGDGT